MAATAAAFDPNDVVKSVQDQVSKVSADFTKAADDVTKANKDLFDAVVKSSEIAFKGIEESAKRLQDYASSSFESGVSAAKDMVGCKNVNELIDLQTNSLFAGKIINKTRISKPHHQEKISREIELHRSVIFVLLF